MVLVQSSYLIAWLPWGFSAETLSLKKKKPVLQGRISLSMHINEVKYTNYWKTTCPQRRSWSLQRSVHCYILSKQTHRGGEESKFIARPVSCPPGRCTTAISMLIFSLWLGFLSKPGSIRLLSCHYLQQLIAKFSDIWCIRNQLWGDNVVVFSIRQGFHQPRIGSKMETLCCRLFCQNMSDWNIWADR